MIAPTVDAWHAPPAGPRPVGRDVPVVSPELALVDAELRSEALASLPELQPFAFLDALRRAPVEPPAWLIDEPATSPPDRASRLLVAGLAYLLTAIMRTLAFNVAVFCAVAIVVLVLNALA